MNNLKRVLLAVLTLVVVGACDNSTPAPTIVPEVYIESTLITKKSREDIANFAKSSGLPFQASDIKYSTSIYKITYKTTFKGQEITASGVVVLPDTKDAAGMLSFQHGTISANAEAPTNTPASSNVMNFYAAIGSVGLIGVAPDFIGFGASSNVVHPYYLEKPTADAVVDCLKAAREFALVSGGSFNGKLFLAGYSQGGYATMAAHKSIEENGLDNFDLIASFPAAGGYDVKGVQEYFFKQTTYSEPFYLAFVANAYKTHLGWSQPLSDLFQEPYAGKIPGLFNGQNGGGQINSQLTTDVKSLVQADILANINTAAKYKYINDAFADNSPTDWIPKKRMFMYHGDIDITVPYQNSVDVYNSFIARGASPQVVTFTPLPFGTHGSGVSFYLINLIRELNTLR